MGGDERRAPSGRFPTTHWSRVAAAGDRAAPEPARPWPSSASAYWYPLYAFVRRQGHAPEEAARPRPGLLRPPPGTDVLAAADPAGAGSARS